MFGGEELQLVEKPMREQPTYPKSYPQDAPEEEDNTGDLMFGGATNLTQIRGKDGKRVR